MMHGSPHDQIAPLAYRLWEDRGRPYGSPETDWYEAEHLLNASGRSAKWVQFINEVPGFVEAVSDGLDCIVRLAQEAPQTTPERLIGMLTGTMADDLYDVLFLCENDRLDGALRLLRSPYEKFLYAHFIAGHPDAAEDFEQFDDHQSYTLRMELVKFNKIPISDVVKAALEAKAKVARDKFKKSKCPTCGETSERRWTKVTPQEMMEAAKVESLHTLAYRFSTLMIHPSIRGLDVQMESALSPTSISVIVFRLIWETLKLQWASFKKNTTATGHTADVMRKIIAVSKGEVQ
jgi:hypothetical protein